MLPYSLGGVAKPKAKKKKAYIPKGPVSQATASAPQAKQHAAQQKINKILNPVPYKGDPIKSAAKTFHAMSNKTEFLPAYKQWLNAWNNAKGKSPVQENYAKMKTETIPYSKLKKKASGLGGMKNSIREYRVTRGGGGK